MEYAGSYALYNYRLADPALGMAYDNLRLIRAFEHGLDPSSSEAGFVLVHVDMVQNSGPLVDGAVAALQACQTKDSRAFDAGLKMVVDAMTKVNAVMDGKTPRAASCKRLIE
jgi:indoleamine 2,3-dioxygenase